MKQGLVFCFLATLFFTSTAQEKVYMKDGKLLGNRKDLVESCAKGMGEGADSSLNKEGICDCMINSISVHFTFKQFMKLVEKGDFDFAKMMKDKKKSSFADDVMKCML